MKAAFLFIVLALLCSASLLEAKRTTKDLKIIGGTAATEGEFPWMVKLLIPDSADPTLIGNCGGSIINGGFWVVTAAHCFNDFNPRITPATSIVMEAGVVNLDDTTNPSYQLRYGLHVYVHPLYNQSSSNSLYDIALIRVLYGFNLGNNVAAIPYGTKVPSNGPGFVAGWGLTTEGGDLSNTLLWTEIPFVAFSQCNNAFGGDLDSKIQVCAGGVAGHDTCQGDSGGPLFTATDPANPTDAALIGLTSFGRGCGGDTPGVYTNVPDFGAAWVSSKFSSVACRTSCVTEFRLCKSATTGNRRCRQLKNRCYLYCLPLPRPTISS